MSAFNFLTLRPETASTAADSIAAPRGVDAEPRGQDAARTFRDELSDVETPRAASARPERQSAASTDAQANTSTQDAGGSESADPQTQASDDPQESPAAVRDGEEDASSDLQAADSPPEAGEGQAASDDSTDGLIAAFAQVLQDNPAAQGVEAVVREAGSSDADASETNPAAIEPRTQTAGPTQGPNAGVDASGLTLGGVVSLAASSQTGTAANPAAASTTPSSIAEQPLTGVNTNTPQNNTGGTPNGNTPRHAAASAEASLNVSAAPPEAEPVTANAAAPAVSASLTANPAGGESAAASVANPTGVVAAPVTASATATQASATTPGTAPVTTDAPTSATDALNAARLTRGLNNAVNQQGGSVTLRLTPPEFGTVRIHLDLQGTSVSARFHAETDSAQRLLSQQLGQLRATLEAQGLNVERLGVGSLNGSSNSSGLQQQNNNDQSQANTDGRSRGGTQQGASGSGGNDGGQDRDGGEDARPFADDPFTELLDQNSTAL